MKFHRIYAIVIRHFYSVKHNFDRFSDVFYWPMIDMFVWGLTSTYLNSGPFKGFHIVIAIVSALVFWSIAWRMPYEVAVGLLDDLWSRNLINIFVSPLTFSEWVISLMIISFIKSFTSFLWSASLAFFLYKVGIFSYGIAVIPFIFLLMFTGWTLGFLITALILRFGLKVQAFAWTLGAIIMPFSAIYYPLNILPHWAQNISSFVPTSYVFEGIRDVIYKGFVDPNKIFMSFLLNIVYFILAIIFIRIGFKYILKKGLVKLL